MHDLKFDRATAGISWPPAGVQHDLSGTRYVVFQSTTGMKVHLRKEASAPELSKVLRSLLTNVNRTMALLHLLPMAFEEARRVEMISRRVTSPSANDGLVDDFWVMPTETDAEHNEWHRLVQLAKDKYELIRMQTDIDSFDPIMNRPFATAADEIRYVSSGKSENTLSVGMEAILHAAILGAFTAFESCATDLWIKAVDLRPSTLAYNVVMLDTTASVRREDKKPVDSAKQKKQPRSGVKQQEPTIKFTSLANHNFNVSLRMGHFLKEEGRVSFSSLWGIKTAYYDAFRTPGDDDHRTAAPLASFFDSAYPELKALEAIRNLLAHRGGIVDQQFREEVEGQASLYALSLGEMIPVDGVMVQNYLRAVIQVSVFLLNFVAEWIDTHKE